MIILTSILTFLAIVVAFVMVLIGIIKAVIKKPAKKSFITAGASFVAFIVFMIASLVLSPSPSSDNVATETDKTEETTATETVKEESKTTEEDAELDEVEAEETVEEVEPEDKSLHIDDYIVLDDELLNSIQRKPDEYYGEGYKFTGRVIQVLEGDDGNVYRVAINDDYDNVAVLTLTTPLLLEERILEDDYITFYATYRGITQYDTTSGGQVSAMLFDISRSAHLLERIEE